VFYSYAGKMNIGLLVAPEDFPQPYRFLDEIRDSLNELLPLAHETLSQSYTTVPASSAPT
jgi:WS/DGAT C-terminal domain